MSKTEKIVDHTERNWDIELFKNGRFNEILKSAKHEKNANLKLNHRILNVVLSGLNSEFPMGLDYIGDFEELEVFRAFFLELPFGKLNAGIKISFVQSKLTKQKRAESKLHFLAWNNPRRRQP